jgi:AcrR family transcriptional regulator
MESGQGTGGEASGDERPRAPGPAAGPAGGMPRAAELLWGGRQRGGRGRRPAFSLDRIVEQAVAVADTEGLGALSMQRLARELGAGTMSLYRYVPSKEELISLMLDAVLDGPPQLPDDDWRSALERWARANREVFRRHPWALGVVISKRVMGPNETAWAEAALRACTGTGLPAPVLLDIMMSINGYVRGAVQLEVDPARGRDDGTTAPLPSINPALLRRFGAEDRYPTLLAAMRSPEASDGAGNHGGSGERGRGDRDAGTGALFEFGLQRLLDGIDVLARS